MERRLKRLLTPPFLLLAAFLLWFWEWLWEPLAELMARLGRLPLLRVADRLLAAAPPSVALVCFAIPGLALLPFKLVGLYFIARGAPLLGIATFVAAKVVGTALLAHIFALTKPQLLQLAWFARAYAAAVAFHDRVFAALHGHPLYRRTRARLLLLRRGLLGRLVRRWRAVLRKRGQDGKG